MNVRHVFILMAALLVTCLVVMFWPRPAFAEAEPACLTPDDITAALAEGETIAGAAYYRGQMTDTMLVVETAEAIIIYGFKDGCLAAAVSLEPVEPVTPA